MTTLSSDKILSIIPSLFNIDLKSNLFRALEKFLIFDEGFFFFANHDSLQLKYAYKKHIEYKPDSIYTVDNESKTFIFSQEGKILDNTSKLINTLGLNYLGQNSFLVSKIAIKSTVFGIIILSSKTPKFYEKSDLNALNVASSILSYVLKDLELSNVFKIQLQALKDGIIEKNKAYKTIKEQNEKILEADKIKNEFLANVSHELRTPLNSILGFSDILSTELYGNLNEKQAEFLGIQIPDNLKKEAQIVGNK